ncbi:GIY-YIG nuclease family protein [Bacillus subtilis]|uniref:GIY-YIG nuclease family protein n=1 Tax=Bacillus subtilis TaxID=1423 RepID=UPI001BA2936F|nr:GIY-YIG nuclease family protein [Bacillus subtilis]CAF1802675.1 UvrABC system protein C [Bacillus subtilis]CAF1877280.1 UvrABC system protein C [Bacillus subtilis]CAF1879285.1 UvrABC system protein C [Bacillus subtilis]CAF1897050.1 UvrABC system protein C [Bacillus subtilis]
MIQITIPENYKTARPRDIKNKNEFDRAGVYVFFDEDNTPLYVGKSVSFKRRFIDHSRNSEFYYLASYARLYEIDNDYERDIYETEMIRQFDPLYNKAKMYHRRKEVEEALSEIEIRAEDLIAEIRELHEDIGEKYERAEETDYITGQKVVVDCVPSNEIQLGEVLYLNRRINEIKEELKKLYAKKRGLMIRRGL